MNSAAALALGAAGVCATGIAACVTAGVGSTSIAASVRAAGVTTSAAGSASLRAAGLRTASLRAARLRAASALTTGVARAASGVIAAARSVHDARSDALLQFFQFKIQVFHVFSSRRGTWLLSAAHSHREFCGLPIITAKAVYLEFV